MFDPDAHVVLSDVSPDAIAVAQENIQAHSLAQRVTVNQGDLFSGLDRQTFDLILSNPPYVDANDLSEMPAEYHHEPAIGLGSGVDGLDLSRRILREAAHYLSESGTLVLELGNSYENLEKAYPAVPFTWAAFSSGGHGVLVITRDELMAASF